jgi:hypothetical protein
MDQPNDNSQHSPCAICFEDIECGKNKAIMDCGHTFHFKCIFKWNFTEQGNSCPLCRSSLGLPEDVNFESEDEEVTNMFEYSDYEDEDEDEGEDTNGRTQDDTESTNVAFDADDEETDSDSDTESSDSDTESSDSDTESSDSDNEETDSDSDTESEDSESDSEDDDFLEETTTIFNDLFDKIDNHGDHFMRLKISCNDCEQQVIPCDFCSTPFCACPSTKDKLQGRACPFNKFYRTLFDSAEGDRELSRLLNLNEPEGKVLDQSHVCGKCFANRDNILKATIETILNDEFGSIEWERAIETFRTPEIKSIYYHLFYDNSRIDNRKLYSKYPSYSSYKLFKEAVSLKLNIESNNGSIIFRIDSEQLLEDNFGQLSFERARFTRSNRSARVIDGEIVIESMV